MSNTGSNMGNFSSVVGPAVLTPSGSLRSDPVPVSRMPTIPPTSEPPHFAHRPQPAGGPAMSSSTGPSSVAVNSADLDRQLLPRVSEFQVSTSSVEQDLAKQQLLYERDLLEHQLRAVGKEREALRAAVQNLTLSLQQHQQISKKLQQQLHLHLLQQQQQQQANQGHEPPLAQLTPAAPAGLLDNTCADRDLLPKTNASQQPSEIPCAADIVPSSEVQQERSASDTAAAGVLADWAEGGAPLESPHSAAPMPLDIFGHEAATVMAGAGAAADIGTCAAGLAMPRLRNESLPLRVRHASHLRAAHRPPTEPPSAAISAPTGSLTSPGTFLPDPFRNEAEDTQSPHVAHSVFTARPSEGVEQQPSSGPAVHLLRRAVPSEAGAGAGPPPDSDALLHSIDSMPTPAPKPSVHWADESAAAACGLTSPFAVEAVELGVGQEPENVATRDVSALLKQPELKQPELQQQQQQKKQQPEPREMEGAQEHGEPGKQQEQEKQEVLKQEQASPKLFLPTPAKSMHLNAQLNERGSRGYVNISPATLQHPLSPKQDLDLARDSGKQDVPLAVLPSARSIPLPVSNWASKAPISPGYPGTSTPPSLPADLDPASMFLSRTSGFRGGTPGSLSSVPYPLLCDFFAGSVQAGIPSSAAATQQEQIMPPPSPLLPRASLTAGSPGQASEASNPTTPLRWYGSTRQRPSYPRLPSSSKALDHAEALSQQDALLAMYKTSAAALPGWIQVAATGGSCELSRSPSAYHSAGDASPGEALGSVGYDREEYMRQQHQHRLEEHASLLQLLEEASHEIARTQSLAHSQSEVLGSMDDLRESQDLAAAAAAAAAGQRSPLTPQPSSAMALDCSAIIADMEERAHHEHRIDELEEECERLKAQVEHWRHEALAFEQRCREMEEFERALRDQVKSQGGSGEGPPIEALADKAS